MKEKRFFWESLCLFFRILSIKNFYLGERFILLDTNELQERIGERKELFIYIFGNGGKEGFLFEVILNVTVLVKIV